MADTKFNISLGAFAEKVRDDATKIGILLLKVAEADATLQDYDTVAQILAGSNTEANFTNYVRKTGITGTLTVDDTGNAVSVDIPDQTWTNAGGATNNTLVKMIAFYEETAADSGRVPVGAWDFATTTDGTDLTLQINAAGLWGAS